MFESFNSDSSYAELEMQLDTDAEVPQEAIETAKKFGVELGEHHPDPQEYIIAFLKQLLIQREKLEEGVLNEYLNPNTPPWWKNLLSCLEQLNRKLLKVEAGSIIFTLHCPTKESFQQLSDISWRKEIAFNMQNWWETLGKHCLLL